MKYLYFNDLYFSDFTSNFSYGFLQLTMAVELVPLQLYCCNYLLVEMQVLVLSQRLTTNKRPCQPLTLLENVYPAANRKPYTHYWSSPPSPIVFPITELFINLLKSGPSTRFSECGVKKFLVALENGEQSPGNHPCQSEFFKKGRYCTLHPPLPPSFVEEPASRALIMLFGWT